jgi:hypothetical protein
VADVIKTTPQGVKRIKGNVTVDGGATVDNMGVLIGALQAAV